MTHLRVLSVSLAYLSPGARLQINMPTELPPRASVLAIVSLPPPLRHHQSKLTLQNTSELGISVRYPAVPVVERLHYVTEGCQGAIDS
jgi:hypothetical protein